MPGKSLALIQVIYFKWKTKANEAVQGVATKINIKSTCAYDTVAPGNY
jgi:hypothetical protein